MLDAFGLTHPGCARQNNEDCYLILPELGLYLVADGMGGARAGERASRLATETVAAFLRQSDRRDAQVLVEAFEEAHRIVKAAAKDDPGLTGMGTTLVTGLEAGEELLIASVGDSRLYVFQDNLLRLVTADQTWVAEVGRPLGISEEDLQTHPLRHALTMAVGADAPLRTQRYAVRLLPGTQFLLSSDGLHGVVDAETIREALDSQQSLAAKAHYLLDAAIQAGGPDNITAVLLQVAG